VVDALGFHGAEEALGHRIVPTVASATHAAFDAVGLGQPAEGAAGILGGLNCPSVAGAATAPPNGNRFAVADLLRGCLLPRNHHLLNNSLATT